ncbi:MAG: TraB/VirB10 family protein, partial [Bdellovibrionota bacterium]
MSLKQKLSDGIQLLQKERKVQVIALGIVLAALFLIFHEPKKPRKGPVITHLNAPQSADQLGASSTHELYNDLQQVVIQRLDNLQESQEQVRGDLEKTNKRIEENEIRTAEIFETLIKRVESQRTSIPDYSQPNSNGDLPIGDTPLFPEEQILAADSLETFGEVSNSGAVSPPSITETDFRSAYIAPTDFVRVRLLAGVNAPTDGSPYPVLMELIGDVQSPDGASLALGNARVLAAAQGSLIDSRALFRLTSLTLRMPDGEVQNLPIDGYMVGEDGILGLPGIPIDPLGKVLASTATTGAVAGMGQAMASAQVTNVTNGNGGVTSAFTGDMTTFAIGQGLAHPANLWSDIIRERMQDAVP